MKKHLSLICIFAAIFCLQGVSCAKGNKNLPVKKLSIKTSGGKTVALSAEIARTPEERANGYMFRKNIPEGTGMLFIFEKDQPLSFWMKNTPTPLSIAYIDYKGQIKDIFDMQPFNLNSIESTGFARYALEVPQGWFKKIGIQEGDFLDLSF